MESSTKCAKYSESIVEFISRHNSELLIKRDDNILFQVRYTPWWIKGITLENTDGTECLWETRPGPEECQKDFGICMYRESGCYWTPSVPYKNCIKKYQLEREQKRAREP